MKILLGSDDFYIHNAIRIKSWTTNNEAESLLTRLHLAKDVSAKYLKIFNDLKLAVEKITGESKAREENMLKNLLKVWAFGNVALNIDISQAYDSISWDFL